MKKIKVLQTISYNGQVHTEGDIIEVQNNDAFGLIDGGLAELYTNKIEESPNNKMMTPTAKGKKYKVK